MAWALRDEGELSDDRLEWRQASRVKCSIVVNAGDWHADVEPVLRRAGDRVDGEGVRGILGLDAGHCFAIYRDGVAKRPLRLVVKVIKQRRFTVVVLENDRDDRMRRHLEGGRRPVGYPVLIVTRRRDWHAVIRAIWEVLGDPIGIFVWALREGLKVEGDMFKVLRVEIVGTRI